MGSRVLVNIGAQRFDRLREQKAFYIETAEEYEKEAEAWKLPVM